MNDAPRAATAVHPAPGARRRRRVLRAVLPAAILLAGIGVAGILWATKPRVEAQAVQERVWSVAGVVAIPADIRPLRTYYGEVVAGRRIEIRPQVAGRVVAVGDAFLEGGVVHAGDLLLAVDPFTYEAGVAEREAELREAQARLAEIEADLAGTRRMVERDRTQFDLRRRELQRQDQLTDRGHASDRARDEARLAVAQAEQAVIERERAIAQLSAVRDQQQAAVERLAIGLDRARRDLADTRIVAPADGFLVGIEAAAGKWVGVGDRVAGLVQADALEARFHIGNAAFARLQVDGGVRGRSVELRWAGAPDAMLRYRGVIERVEGEFQAASGGIRAFARIADSDTATALRPGAFVEVAVPDRLFENVVRLPDSALHGGNAVFAVVDGRLQSRPVELVARVDADVLVRGDFADRPAVATTRFPEMGEGVRVEIR